VLKGLRRNIATGKIATPNTLTEGSIRELTVPKG